MLREICLALVVLAIFVTAAVLTWWTEYGSAQLIANAQEHWANRPTKLQEVNGPELAEDNVAAQEEGNVAQKEPACEKPPKSTSCEKTESALQKKVLASDEQSAESKATQSADECRQGTTQSAEAAGASCQSATAPADLAREASCKLTVLPGGKTTVAVFAQSEFPPTKSNETVIVDGQRYANSADTSDDKDEQDVVSSGQASPQAPPVDLKKQAQNSISVDMQEDAHDHAGAGDDAAVSGAADSVSTPPTQQEEEDQQVDVTQQSTPEDGEVNEPELTAARALRRTVPGAVDDVEVTTQQAADAPRGADVSLHARELPQAQTSPDDQGVPANGPDEAVEDAQPVGEEVELKSVETTANRSEEFASDKPASTSSAPASKAKGKKKKGKK